jgi:hypothetical protein
VLPSSARGVTKVRLNQLECGYDGRTLVVRIPRASSAAADGPSGCPRDRTKLRSRSPTAPSSRRSRGLGDGRLDDGVYSTVGEIGDAENISKSYVSRILRLALLAPDVVDAILAGQTDQGLMIEKLERPLPMSWDGQRKQLL